MKPTCAAAEAACLIASACAIALLPSAGGAQTPGPRGPASVQATGLATQYGQPPVTGLDMTFAFDRMNGLTPDFRPYAERSNVYVNATVFDREAVLTREIGRMEGEFRTFNLDKVYSMKVGVPVQQYEPGKGGFPLQFGSGARIGFADPVNYHGYFLNFRNADDVSVIPFPDPTAARNFAQRYGLNLQNPQAGTAVLEVAFRLVDTPPSVQGQDVIRADILSARLLSQTGQPMFDFGATAASKVAVSRNADGTSEQPVLKTADVQGFRLGMTAAEVDALASRGWKTVRGGRGTDEALYFNDLAAGSPGWAVCGDITFGAADLQAAFVGLAVPPTFSDCIAVKFEPGMAGTDPDGRKVVAIAAEQHISGTPDAVLGAVKAKYGAPLYVRNGGSNLAWIGRNPGLPDSPPLEIVANAAVGGPQAPRQVVLTLQEKVFQDTRIKPTVVPAAPSGPKL